MTVNLAWKGIKVIRIRELKDRFLSNSISLSEYIFGIAAHTNL